MAKKITDLTPGAALDGSEQYEIVQSAGSFRSTISAIRTWLSNAFINLSINGNFTSAGDAIIQGGSVDLQESAADTMTVQKSSGEFRLNNKTDAVTGIVRVDEDAPADSLVIDSVGNVTGAFVTTPNYSLVDISAGNQNIVLPAPTNSGAVYQLEAYGGDGTYTAQFTGQTLYKKNTADTGTLSGEGKITVQDVNSRWQIVDFHCVYSSGFVAQTGWLNFTTNVTHGLDANMTEGLDYKFFMSEDGTEATAWEFGDFSRIRTTSTSANSTEGHIWYTVDSDTIQLKVGIDGMMRILASGGAQLVDTESYYWKVTVTRSF